MEPYRLSGPRAWSLVAVASVVSCTLANPLDHLNAGAGGSGTTSSSEGGGAVGPGGGAEGGGTGVGGGQGGDGQGGGTPATRTWLVVTGGTEGADVASNKVVVAEVLDNGELGPWAERESLLTARYEHAIAIRGQRIYVLGGIDGPNIGTVEVATLSSDGSLSPWQEATALPDAREAPAAAISGTRIFVAGGSNGGVSTSVIGATLSDSGVVGAWNPIEELPSPRWRHDLLAIDGRLFVVGGGDGIGHPPNLFSATPDGPWDAISPLPQGLWWPCSASDGEAIYLSGGQSANDTQYAVVRVAQHADGMIGMWTDAPPLAEGRKGHGCAIARGHYFVAGGASNGPVTDTVEAAAIQPAGGLGAFSARAPLPAPVLWSRMAAVEVPIE